MMCGVIGSPSMPHLHMLPCACCAGHTAPWLSADAALWRLTCGDPVLQVAGPAASEAPPEAAAMEDHKAGATHAVPPHAHGPARPPAELLAAAAEAAQAVRTTTFSSCRSPVLPKLRLPPSTAKSICHVHSS